MGTSIASLLILTILFTSALAAFKAGITDRMLFGDSMRKANSLGIEHSMAAIGISSVTASEVLRCASKMGVLASNLGESSIGNLDQMDLLSWYTPQTGGQVTERFSYTSGNIEEGEWTLFGKTPSGRTPLWEPDEAVRLISRLPQPPRPGTDGYVILGTPGGISDGEYVQFTTGALGNCLFLHNDPSPPAGDTSSQGVLPMDTGLPTGGSLYNYDQDRDSTPGLKLVRSDDGLIEIEPARYQVWRTGILDQAMVITGDVLINLWGALSPPTAQDAGVVLAYLRDYDGAGNHVEIGDGAAFARDWQSGSSAFRQKVALLPGIEYTVPPTHQLEIRIIVDDTSGQEIEFAYDTESFPASINLSFIPPAPDTSLYLHNYPAPPIGDTAARDELPMDTTDPTTTDLYTYDLPDIHPGLTLKKGSSGLAETDPAKFQVWRTAALAAPLYITGDVFIDIWAAISNFQQNQPGAFTLYLRD